jgi:hypothetical protein
MAARLGHEQPDPRNPFANPQQPHQFPQPYQQRRRDYDAESDMSDQYGSRNGSSARLAGGSPYNDHGQYDSYSEYCHLVVAVLSFFRTDANLCFEKLYILPIATVAPRTSSYSFHPRF